MSDDINNGRLKDDFAQSLRESAKVIIDGIEINLWQNHNLDTVKTQMGWNKVKSYSELNSQSTGENGVIVFSGVFQIPRKEVLEYAVKLGFSVRSNVSKKTDFFVVGSENVSPSKLAKALTFNEKGANIQFVDENTFLSIVDENLLADFDYSNIFFDDETKEIKKPKSSKKPKTRKAEKIEATSSKLEGLTFVVSGVFTLFSRNELKQLIEQNGGKVSSSISKKTSYIVAGENMGPSKLAKAQDLGVEIIDENKFSELLN